GLPSLAPSTDQRGAGRPPNGPTDLGSVQVSLAATTTTVTSNPTVVFNKGSKQTVTLTATVSSSGIPVNGGVVTFMIAGVGADVQANVNNGQATATFTINAGVKPGKYTIVADYGPAVGFRGSSGSGILTISRHRGGGGE
ncbi:MAG TPA: Ig-like domain-containing protein, partial [Gemmataceae bacterium]